MNETGRIKTSAMRSVGFWLASALALSQLSNAARVLIDPNAYSTHVMGLPISAQADIAWVYVYALRALFLGGFASYLLITAQYRVLSVMALIAVVMPLGDLYLVWQAQGSASLLARHAVIAAILIAAWYSLRRLARRDARTSMD